MVNLESSSTTSIYHGFLIMIQHDFLTSQQDVRLSELSKRDEIWDKYRTQSLAIEFIYKREKEFEKLANCIEDCSCYLEFRLNEGNLVLRKANFCRSRYCYVCMWRKSLYHRAMLYKACERIESRYSNYRFIFLTLTVKNCCINELRLTLSKMNESWRRLIGRKKFMNVVAGWVRSTEITRDSKYINAYAHPHFHCILLVKPSYFSKKYIKQEQWAKIWQECLRVDYFPVVDVRTVRSRHVNDDAVKSAIVETLKYSVKQADINVNVDDQQSREWFYTLTRETRNLRFVACGGVFKDAIKSDEEIDDDNLVQINNTDETDQTSKRLIFEFCREKRFYRFDPDLSR